MEILLGTHVTCATHHDLSRSFCFFFVHTANATFIQSTKPLKKKKWTRNHTITKDSCFCFGIYHLRHTRALNISNRSVSLVQTKLSFSHVIFINSFLFNFFSYRFDVALLSLSLSNDRKWHNTACARPCVKKWWRAASADWRLIFCGINFPFKIDSKLIYPLCVLCVLTAYQRYLLLMAVSLELKSPRHNCTNETLFSRSRKIEICVPHWKFSNGAILNWFLGFGFCLRHRDYGLLGFL